MYSDSRLDRKLYLLFFFNDPPTTNIYTLSLHDALPIYAVVDVADDHHVLLVEVVEGALAALHLDDDRVLLGDEVAVGRRLDLELGVVALHAGPARVGEAAEHAEGIEEIVDRGLGAAVGDRLLLRLRDVHDGEGADPVVDELADRLRLRERGAVGAHALGELGDAHEDGETQDADAVAARDLPGLRAGSRHPDGRGRLLEGLGEDAARRHGDEPPRVLERVLRPHARDHLERLLPH